MAKGRKTGGGSRLGKPNKATQSIREAFEAVFKDLQVSPSKPYALTAWAKGNPTEFYKIASKLIPAQIVGLNDGPIRVDATVDMSGLSTEVLRAIASIRVAG